jgi:hypothetical protein
MSKFLLNHLVQNFKALPIPKINLKFGKKFFLCFSPSSQIGPAHLFGPVRPDGPATSTPLGPRPPNRPGPPPHPPSPSRVAHRCNHAIERRRAATPSTPSPPRRGRHPRRFPSASPIIAPAPSSWRKRKWRPSRRNTGRHRTTSPPSDPYKRVPRPHLTLPHPTPPSFPPLSHRSAPPPHAFGRRHAASSPDHSVTP